ncbi:hypothetical protein [Altibacter sp. HG106]|uniref:hypothetical protein n=1 Tax=Altibacter sp. HG106 TaxID=3023937 RepID=UPI002350923A|nr:hypothetical protein [Altibacter sp. HG106]MDC7994820.1 hypothetical protein [Altibacter sp. HG106]
MENRKLEIYSFYLHEKRKINNKIAPDDIFGKDLFEELRDKLIGYIDTFPPSRLDDKTSRVAKNKSGDTLYFYDSQKRYIYGKLSIGDDNKKEQPVVMADKDKAELYTKQKGHAVERPFFFMIILPENLNSGFIILEREGRHAIKTDFSRILKDFIFKNFANLNVRFKNFIEQDIIKEWMRTGEVKEIVFTRKQIDNDKAENYLGTHQVDGKYDLRLSLIPKERTMIPQFTRQKLIRRIENYSGFFESDEVSELGLDEKTDIKVILDYNNNTRTIDLSDTGKVRPYYHVTVAIDAFGFSELDSIKNEAINLINSFNLGIL